MTDEKEPLPRRVLDGVIDMLDKLNPDTQNELFQVHMLAIDIWLASMLGSLKQTEPEDEDLDNMKVWQREYDFFMDMRATLRLHCGEVVE